jgi:hypothetical protein
MVAHNAIKKWPLVNWCELPAAVDEAIKRNIVT